MTFECRTIYLPVHRPHPRSLLNISVLFIFLGSEVAYDGGQETVLLDQRRKPMQKPFQLLGAYSFAAHVGTVLLSNADTDGLVMLDAIKLVCLGP